MGSLSGARVLVTRSRGQASALAEMLRAEGAEAVVIPTIELAAPESWCGLDAALASLRSYDWVVFTSANAVEAFAQRSRALKIAAQPKRVAVVGPATAKAVEEWLGRAADLMPERYVAEALVEALRPHAAGAAVLLVRAAVARDVLPEGLVAAGAVVTIAQAYRNVAPEGSVEELRELFRANPPDAITFTSASTAVNLAGLLEVAGLGIPEGTVLASIGPVTSRAMRDVGMEPTVEAAEATIAGLLGVIARAFEDRAP